MTRPKFPGLNLVMDGDASSWAAFSDCRRYRYALGRVWNEDTPLLVAVCLNPSTATHKVADPTLKKLCHYARRDHFGGVWLANAFAFRATDPAELDRAHRAGIDVVGRDTTTVMRMMIEGPLMAKAVGGWGRARWAWMRHRFKFLRALGSLRYWHCWGVTKDGNPKHPLYLKNTAPLIEFRRPA